MKLNQWMGWSSALFLCAMPLQAQTANDVELLRKQLKELQQNFEQQQQLQRQQIEALTKQLEAVQQKQTGAVAEQEKLKQQLTERAVAPAAIAPPWSPSQPITLAKAGSAYMNISFDALMDFGWSTAKDPSARLQLGDHDPVNRGFSLRNAEIALDGAVDPYFKGFANIVLKLDKDNATGIELEETYLQSTALPANLQLKAGQFFANFGRQNPQHPHQWAFVDQPLILNRTFGPDGLRNVGAQLSWLVPTPFYTEAFLGVFNGQGSTAHSFRNRGESDNSGVQRLYGRATLDRGLRGAGDLLFVPRVASSFDLTDTQTLLVGASAAFGPNDTGAKSRTEIYGVDAFWKWKPADAHGGWPFVSWQNEALYRRFGAGADATALAGPLPRETITDYGFYSQASWGFTQRWVASARSEWVSGGDSLIDAAEVFRGDRTRISPALTWHPSEFSKIRLQYNYDRGQNFGADHSVWLQLEFTLGAHGAHKY